MTIIQNHIDLKKAINPAYKKHKPLAENVEKFISNLKDLVKNLEIISQLDESEEHLKSVIKKFLESTFYNKHEINTKGRIDLAIYLGKDVKSDVGVIIEAKRISNKHEFPTLKNLNKKALQELLYYYLQERIDHKNNNIKHLIITNGLEWFFFKGEDFYDFFYKNKGLVKEYELFRNGLKDTNKNELFYNEIAYKYIDKVKDNLPFVYQNFQKESILNLKEKEIINIYKLFSDTHLLGKSFGNDSNKLNKEFYNELLHIIGLEEVKEKSKRIIQRKKSSERDYGSLIENTIFCLEDRDYLSSIRNIPNDENKSFTVGLELCLTWINRVLFLKLLESQLLTYNKDKSYRFLNSDFISGFDELNDLFFSALARPANERHVRYADKFKRIPYLNSSLFEHNKLEKITFDITALKDEEMHVYTSTILRDSQNRKLKGKIDTLEYIFRFLDAYDFTTDVGIQIDDKKHESRSLINASVLGLIFEKINGYKDGSFYTPGLITMYMCRETIQRIVVHKFKESENNEINTFDDVKSYCKKFFKRDDIERFNNLVNSIKICDPSVGSGHFLVSALNEIIAIKSELGILADDKGRHLQCEISVENDELFISDAHGDLFEYHRTDPNSLRIQKSIFHEKQRIIENCLFGVDINPNSVNICRLRLWIELLKNAYYTDEGELQTLPNIDINIKNGNSLIHRFKMEDSLKSAFKNKKTGYSIEEYKQAVNDYKQTNSKTKKREIEEIIDAVKNNFNTTLDKNILEKVQKAKGLHEQEEIRQKNLKLFGEKLTKADRDALKKLNDRKIRVIKEKDEILNNANFRNAFEWRFEFPEVLDDEGNYVGFDAIIGNPPYIQLQKMGTESEILQKMKYETYAKTGDIYSLFYELGYDILRPKGILNFITSNKWMRAAYGASLRKFLAEKTNPIILIDFAGTQIFDTATVDTNILMFSKDKNRQQTRACVIKENVLNNLSVYFRQNANIIEIENSENWIILSPIEKQIKDKIDQIGRPLKNWDININYGIKTGFNEAFIIDLKKKDELIKEDPKSVEIIRPILRGRDIKRYSYDFANLWLINTHNGVREKDLNRIHIDDYPAIKKHLDQYYSQLEKRADKGDTPYNLRNCAYMEDFFRPKIIFQEMVQEPSFILDLDGKFMCLDTARIITGIELEVLICLLNSNLFFYAIKNFYGGGGLGQTGVRMKHTFFQNFPAPLLTDAQKKELVNLSKTSNNTSIQKINDFFYKAFQLNDKEIEAVEMDFR